jgi:putative ABC transport system permease protein
MDHDDLSAHSGTGLDEVVLVSLATTHPATVASLRAVVADLAPGATILPGSSYRGQLDTELAANGWTERVITVVLLLYVIIAAVNTLVMYGLGRRREFAVLRLAGTTRRQVRRMVALEPVILLGLTLDIGVAIAAATLVPMVRGITGTATPYIPPPGWAAVLGGVLALGTIATVGPLRRLLRDRPVESMGLRE